MEERLERRELELGLRGMLGLRRIVKFRSGPGRNFGELV